MTSHDSAHDSAVAQIAKSMLTFRDGEVFPGAWHPTWSTFTNAPTKTIPVHHKWEGEIWPDIVVVDTARSNAPRLVAEVETEETIDEMTLDRKWKLAMDESPNMYLFVPRGSGVKAARLLLKFRGMTHLPRAMYAYEFDDLFRVKLTPV